MVYLTLISYFSLGQVVTGTLIDSKTLKPVSEAHIVVYAINGQQVTGCSTDGNGLFTLNLSGGSILKFASIRYPHHEIHGIKSDSNRIELGPVYLIDAGTSGYVLVSKKKFLSKKTKLVCVSYDNRRKLSPDDLVMKCPDGNVSYIWDYNVSENMFSLNFHTLKSCN